MALDAFLDFFGNIRGSVTQKERQGKVRVYGVEHKIEAPADGVPGTPNAKPLTGDLIVTISVDLALPKLHAAMQANKVFKEVRLEQIRMPPRGGPEENYLTVSMTDVRVKSIRFVMRFNKSQDDSLVPEVAEVTLSYKDFSITYKDEGTTDTQGPFTPPPQ